jgi:regulator of protease activity HflC (stomatin/prohibitin superfamily)
MSKFLEILAEFWKDLVPFLIIDQYEKGVLLRNGIFRKVCEAGLHWKIPFFEKIVVCTTVTTTMNLGSQSLTTLDGHGIVTSGVVKYSIGDVKVFLMDVCDAVDAIADMTQAIIKECVMERNWEDLRGKDVDKEITKKAKSEAKRWGIDIEKVTLVDVGIIKSYRLFNSTSIS